MTTTPLSRQKTRIVCTIGPASRKPAVIERMIRRGMDVARLNLAHGHRDGQRAAIAALRAARDRTGRRLTLLADLPGPKLRVDRIDVDPIELKRGQMVRLVGLDAPASCPSPQGYGDADTLISLTLPAMPASVGCGADVFLNDGLIQLRVQGSAEVEVGDGTSARVAVARVLVGGTLRSHDGISLPGVDLGVSAFTDHDRELLAFAVAEGIDAVGISFVRGPEDVLAVREAAQSVGGHPFLVAKIERSEALDQLDAILGAADGLMVARGDLGVDLPIERIAVVQKLVIARANALGKPVITATQMLESMTEHRRPTRAEVTDVSNAILDGTDCVMLSEETAMGLFPAEAVEVMADVAAYTETHLRETQRPEADAKEVAEVLAQEAAATAERLGARYIVVPTETGKTARSVARLRPLAWIVAFSPSHEVCQQLQFSRGVHPVHVPDAARAPMVGSSADWHFVARRWFQTQGLKPGLAVVIQGGSRLEVIDLAEGAGAKPV
jgi:pyruvate kinase